MKKRILISFIFFSATALYGEFGPWKSDVKTGDSIYGDYGSSYNSAKVTNGAQGGAFILVRFFQVVISPQDGANCRHIPTCSAYGRKSVRLHGAFVGAVMAGERILRCNPFYPPERDPVPDRAFGR